MCQLRRQHCGLYFLSYKVNFPYFISAKESQMALGILGIFSFPFTLAVAEKCMHACTQACARAHMHMNMKQRMCVRVGL